MGCPLIGRTFGKCRLLSLLGKGGMTSVYLAEHLFLRRRVAVKILSPDESGRPASVEQFEKGAVAAARLNHPNIVKVHDVDEQNGRPFLIMEYVEGTDLEQVIRRRSRLSLRRSTALARDVALALVHSHAAGVVHRDIKPANILIGRNGQVKVTDFGLAFLAGGSGTSRVDGTVMGTPHYMSPEQVLGGPLDGRSDLYSLGITLHEMLAGRRLFDGASPESVMRRHLEVLPQEIPGLSPTLPVACVLRRLLARSREARYASASELVGDLDGLLGPGLKTLGRERGTPWRSTTVPAAGGSSRRRTSSGGRPV